MKKSLPFFILLLLLGFCSQTPKNESSINSENSNEKTLRDKNAFENSVAIDDLKYKNAILYCRKQKLDTNIAFFVDMSIHSGKKRFFVADLQTKKINNSGLCCHGMGKNSTGASPVFSNEKESNCTSLGKYKTGIRSYSSWGINVHYKMLGLEKTNGNAFDRIIVLHSYDPVPEAEIYPEHLPMGWSQGCPVISNKLMTTVDKLLKKRKRSVLLWIYN